MIVMQPAVKYCLLQNFQMDYRRCGGICFDLGQEGLKLICQTIGYARC